VHTYTLHKFVDGNGRYQEMLFKMRNVLVIQQNI